MNQRAQYLIQILDKIGAPLLGAAEGHSDDAETAQIVASLLGKVVEASISMNQALDLNVTDAQDDSLRVALAALAGSLIADQYKQKGKVPEAGDLNRIQSAMSAVLTFGDNFTLSDDHVNRLEKLKADGGVVDAHQINIQYVDAFIPVINAVGAFPFGQPEQKLIMDVSDRLVKRTAEMRETLLPGLSGDDEKLAELAILRAVAHVYAACHDAETQRLTASSSEASGEVSIAPVWAAFETRTAMLESVVKNIMPGTPTSTAAPSPAMASPVAPVAPAATPEPPPVDTTPTETPQTPTPAIFQTKPADDADQSPAAAPAEPPAIEPPPPVVPPSPPPVAESDAQAGGNPMSFFGSNKPNDEEPPAEPPATEPPPPVAPPSPPPIDTSTPSEDDKGDSGDGGGNPMSFFGKKD